MPDLKNDWKRWAARKLGQPVGGFQPEQPSLAVLAIRLARELRIWKKQGYKLASFDEIRKRNDLCNQCEYSQARLIFGILSGCSAPGCGCSKLKLVLASSFCPHPDGQKWGVSKVLQRPLQKA